MFDSIKYSLLGLYYLSLARFFDPIKYNHAWEMMNQPEPLPQTSNFNSVVKV